MTDDGKVTWICLRPVCYNGIDMGAGQLLQLPAGVLSGSESIVIYEEAKHGKRCRTIEQDGVPVGCVVQSAWDPWKVLND